MNLKILSEIQILDKRTSLILDKTKTIFLNDLDTWKSIPYLITIAMLFYFVALNFFSITIDSEHAPFRADAICWIKQGRWATYFIEQFIISKTTVPFLPIAIFCFFISISYVLVLISHNIKATPLTYYLFPIFCAFPSWRYITEFSANMPSLAWGIFASSLAAYIYRKITVKSIVNKELSPLSGYNILGIIFQIILFASAIGCYQSFIFLFPCLCIGIIVSEALENKNIILQMIMIIIITTCIISMLSLLIYGIIQLLLLNLLDLKIEYLDNFYNPAMLLDNPLKVISETIKVAKGIYTGSSSLYGAPMTATGLLIVLGFTSVLFSEFPSNKVKSNPFLKPTIFGLCLLCLIAPFGMNFMSGGSIPFRSLVSVPYVVWLFSFLAFKNRFSILKILSGLALALCFYQILYLSSLNAASRQLTQHHDFMLASSIYDRIAGVNPDFNRNQVYRIDFFGAKPMENVYPQPQEGTMGASLFQWEGGAPGRMVSFMRLIGYPNLQPLPKDERLKLIPEYDKMPIWPAPGSVKLYNNVTLIKLGPVPGRY